MVRKAGVIAVAVAVAASAAVSAPAAAAISSDVASSAPTAIAASAVPQADVISVDFTEDGPVEHVKDRPVSVEGTAPNIVYDETVERYIADFVGDTERTSTGTGAYVYDISDAWSTDDPEYAEGIDLLDGGTFECYFRYDGDSPVPGGQSSQLCAGGPEGYAFYLPATGCCLRFKATSTSANVNTATAPIPVKPGEWVHAVATVGDGEVKLYLNGTPAWELEPQPGNGAGSGRNHVSPYSTLRVDSVPKWGIGATPREDGFAQPAHIAVAASRAWSSVLTEAQVAMLWNEEKPSTAEEVDPGDDPGEENPDEPNPNVDVPAADVLDVDFSDEAAAFRDHSPANRQPKVTGTADVTVDRAFTTQPHNVYTTDGQKDHAFYPLQDAWADTGAPRTDDTSTWADDSWAGDGLTLQCDIKVNQSLPVTGTPHVCAGKSAGGFGLHLSNSSIVASMHINGGYKSIGTPALQSGVWYSVVATFDGTEIDLYLDGKLVGTNATGTVGQIKAPTAGSTIEPYVRYFALGSDVAGRGSIESPASVSIGNARIWSSALNADQAARLDRDSFGDRTAAPELVSSVPAAGTALETPTEFAVTISDHGLATGWRYELDGTEIHPGDVIGAGMEAGDHEIAIFATDVFGRSVNWTIPFTSLRIPLPGGTETRPEDNAAVLSATATGVADSITTTFTEARLTEAPAGVQGTISVSLAELDLDFADEADDVTAISGGLAPGDDEMTKSPASHDAFPFQRFDIDLPNAERGQQLLWSGQADPTRIVKLWAWDQTSESWSLVDESRGVADGDTHLQSEIHARLIDSSDENDPVVHVAVTAEDPFADDLSPRDESAGSPELKDHFEAPEDYDFSFVHYTDAQYTTEVASGSDMEWASSLPWQHIEGATNTPAESAVFAQSLREQNQWIGANKDERKISYVANTGDVINSNVSLSDMRFDPDAVDPGDGSSVFDYTTSDGSVPGAKEQIGKEFETIVSLQEDLWESGVPNQAVAGNHDNYNGAHNGPKSPFAAFFAADEYYDQAAELWPAGASFHTMDEVTDSDTGAVATRGKDSSNSYVLFSAGGLDFVAVGLSYGVTQEESDWADSVFKRYSDRNGILITHGYVSASSEPDGRTGRVGADGSKLYDEVVRSNANVFLVLGGHFHGVGTNVETIPGVQSNHKVVQMLADYQGYMVPAETIFSKERCAAAGLDTATQCVFGTGDDAGKIDVDGDGSWDHLTTDKLAMGASFMRMLQFNTAENTMSVDTYSPFLDEFGATPYDHGSSPKNTPEPINRYNGAEDNLTVPINLSTRTTSFATDGLVVATPTDVVIGTETVPSGTPATVRWSDLTAGEMYAWTASSTEAGTGASTDASIKASTEAGTLVQFGGLFQVEGSDAPDPEPGDGGGSTDPGAGSGDDGASGGGQDGDDGGAGGQDGELPRTGAEASTAFILAAVLLLAFGAGMAVFTRRRKGSSM
ncbi:LamG-like jellyroll fold domain-containing protein [Microbacterium sp.]|uniref:LamG-like jellyroll fold domain-containing protein n=1 Tax=Microbacterium sp. TaxID=51671 RepID=UPI00262732B5|nr:LamG-like jellyroll fold domain-containing protein [Microbacterium sp.]